MVRRRVTISWVTAAAVMSLCRGAPAILVIDWWLRIRGLDSVALLLEVCAMLLLKVCVGITVGMGRIVGSWW